MPREYRLSILEVDANVLTLGTSAEVPRLDLSHPQSQSGSDSSSG